MVEAYLRRVVDRGGSVDPFVDVVRRVPELVGRSVEEVLRELEREVLRHVDEGLAREVAREFGLGEEGAAEFVARRIAMWAIATANRLGMVVLRHRGGSSTF